MFTLPDDVAASGRLAVGVSGGPDSMALLHLLAEWSALHDVTLYVLSVDHGLRADARAEVEMVGEYCARWEHVKHYILSDEKAVIEGRVQESARTLRYGLMAEKCMALGVSSLCLAHHMDDQGETFLFRLSKGSGLDGLCAMQPVSRYSDVLQLVRPMLHLSKTELLDLCAQHDIPFVEDPSNEDESYARVRLRAASDVLATEGLSNKRMAVTAKRLQRAQAALEGMAVQAYEASVQAKDGWRRIECVAVRGYAEEIVLRVLLRCISELRADESYAPRMERVEDLFSDFWRGDAFRKRTLGGLVFDLTDNGRFLQVSIEEK